MRIGILADDLTSAMDGAAPFARRGHVAAVEFRAKRTALTFDGVLCVDKDSRLCGEKEAGRRAFAAAAALKAADLLYHTVDSTIRGHLEAEILSSLTASGRTVAIVAPAFPEAGRTTLDGVQCLDGRPVSMTDYALDPVHPVREAYIRRRFPSIPDTLIRHLGRGASQPLAPRAFAGGKAKLIIADAESQADLDRLVDAVANPREVLFCGSPGMARALATRCPGRGLATLGLPGASLIIAAIGSLNSVSVEQRQHFASREGAVEIVIDPQVAAQSPPAAARLAIAAAGAIPAGARSIVIGTDPNAGWREDPRQVRDAFGIAVAELVRSLPVTGLILAGGDIATAALRALAATSIPLIGEVEPGIPIGLIDAPRPIGLVTKAGGFGAPDALAVSAARLRGESMGFAT